MAEKHAMMFKTYPKIYILGHEENLGILECRDLVISEKVDGTNVRFALNDKNEIIFGTHHTELGTLDQIPKNHLHRKPAELIMAKVQPNDLNPHYIYFMEGFGEGLHHTIKYPLPTSVIGVDIWLWAEAPSFADSELRGAFISATAAKHEFEKLGFPFTPILYMGDDKWSYENLQALLGDSQLYSGILEGIVIKSYNYTNKRGSQLFAKLVREEFKEEMKVVWGTGKSIAPEPDIVTRYCTPARIAKKFYELIASGATRGMELVPVLGDLVYRDIWEENWQTLIYTKKPIDFGVMRGQVIQIVVRELRRLLVENAS